MKVFWWQLGLHLEPETVEETKALRLLVDNVRFSSIVADPSLEGTGVLCQQSLEYIVRNSEIDPSRCCGTVEQFADQ
jgi:hypothetical protein